MKISLLFLLIYVSTLNALAAEPAKNANAHNIANVLNARYKDISTKCTDGSAAFHCNGVLIRVADNLGNTSGERKRNAVSFTYLRTDIGIKRLYSRGPQGLILKVGLGSPTVRCAFPTNAATDTRPDGCGMTSQTEPGLDPNLSRHCDEQGIDNDVLWLAHFNKVKPRYAYMCALRPTPEQFASSIKVRKLLPADYQGDWNEVVISAWRLTDLKNMPIDALFYNPLEPNGKDGAKRLQQEFYGHTNRLLPIARIDLLAEDHNIFSYHQEDQTTIPMK
jgi:hypothetical protein